MLLVDPLGMLFDLRLARPPFLDAKELEARSEKAIDVCRNHPVVLDHAGRNPFGNALPFEEIGSQRPRSGSRRIALPSLLHRGRVDRVLDGEDQAPARREPLAHRREKPGKVRDVVDRERAEDHIE